MKLNLEEKLERERMENVMEKMSLEEQVVKLLKEKNLKVSTTESCTGGFLAGTIVNVSGASSVFDEGYITYSNEAKQKILGVKAETLEQYGAVSEETAREMAQGCAKKAEVDIAVGITGIALRLIQESGVDAVVTYFEELGKQLTNYMLLLGAKALCDLRKVPVIFGSDTLNYILNRDYDLASLSKNRRI